MRKPQTQNQSPCHSGILELHTKGYGFLRSREHNLDRSEDDPFVPESLIKRHRLQSGSLICGSINQQRNRNRGPKLSSVSSINGIDIDDYQDVVRFDDLRARNPARWLHLEHDDSPVSMRVIDLLAPIGRGQRALIAAPPRAGKTTLLSQIGKSIQTNYPDVMLKTLLIDERPEEVSDMIDQGMGDVFASNLDQSPESHARLAKLVIAHCQQLAETGNDVVLLVDSLTRLSRAFNKLPQTSGTTGAGGLNIRALDFPKKLFGSARAFHEGGSLTIIASVLIETDNRMDDVIFREFKGTGNMDLVLDRSLADRRIWPAIDIIQSATRRVELLHDPKTIDAITTLRNSLLSMPPDTAMRELTAKLNRFPTNRDFVDLIQSATT